MQGSVGCNDVLGRCSVGQDIGLELLSKLVRCVAILGCKALTSEAGCFLKLIGKDGVRVVVRFLNGKSPGKPPFLQLLNKNCFF